MYRSTNPTPVSRTDAVSATSPRRDLLSSIAKTDSTTAPIPQYGKNTAVAAIRNPAVAAARPDVSSASSASFRVASSSTSCPICRATPIAASTSAALTSPSMGDPARFRMTMVNIGIRAAYHRRGTLPP